MTSGKVSKKTRKDEKAELKADLENQLEAAKAAQAEKLAQSKEHFASQLSVASEKYLTVNGYMQARSTYDQVAFGETDGPGWGEVADICRDIASDMSNLVSLLAGKLEAIDVMDLDESFLEGYLDMDFVNSEQDLIQTVKQLLIVNLLQNIGPSIDDIVQFRDGSTAGIAKLKEELDALDDKKDGLTLVQ